MHTRPVSVKAVFDRAVELASQAERQAYLDEACAGAPEFRRKVEALLRAYEEAGSFLESPPCARDLVATVDESIPGGTGSRIGPYKLLEQIGEGGMGLVYVAEQHEPIKRRVALKIIKPGMDSRQVVARFEAERQALAMMDHAHIAKVYDGGATPEGRPYFVMELVKGTAITDYCDAHRLGTRQRLELFLDVCHAVQHAHQKGVIHRDLKPSNVLVEVHDVRPVVKVIDFGIAKATGQQLTDKSLYTGIAQMIGTPLYMSPEQAGLSSLDVDTRSDVYSLGVLLYELLTGTTPFDGETLKQVGYDEMRRIIREDEPPRPSTRLGTMDQAALSTIAERRGLETRRLSQQLRGELDWIVMKALEKDRNRRYESASAFAADVQRYLNDEPVQACPPSVGYKVRKFVRRHRAAVLVAACMLLGATVFGVTVTWLQRQQAALQTQIEGEVNLALGQADLLQKQKKWAEARDAVKRAQGLLQTGTANEELQQRVQQRLTDLTLAAELEQIFTDRMTELAGGWWGTLSNPGIDKRYAEAFQKGGIDVPTLSVEEAADKIRQRGIHAEIATALDNWTAVRAYSVGFRDKDQDQVWKKLQELATVVDPDPFRIKLRKVAWEFDDPQKLLDSPELLEQPMPVIMSMALSVLLFQQGEGRYEKVLRELHRRHPQDFWVNFELGSESSQPVDAVRFSMAALTIQPEFAATHLQLGIALQRMGRLDDALAEFGEARRLRQDFFETHAHLGEALAAKERWEEALECFREAVHLANPATAGRKRVSELHHSLGNTLLKQGKQEEAIAVFREALKIEPNNAETHYHLARALSQQGKWDETLAALQKVRKLAPKNPAAHNGIAWFWATCPEGKYRDPVRAVASAKKAVELAPGNGEFWNTLGVAHYRNGEWKESIAALMKAVQLRKGGDGSEFFFLAMAHWQLREKEKARTWYDQAVAWMDKHKPQDEELKRFRAEAAALLGLAKAAQTPKTKD